MPVSRTFYYPKQTIHQVYNGVSKVAIIPNSGGYSSIKYIEHNPLHLGRGDCGGPMILHRDNRIYHYGHAFAGLGKGSDTRVEPNSPGSGPIEPLNSDLYGYGGTAIARTLPTNPEVDVADILAQSVGRDQIPKALGASLWRDRMFNLRSLGKEFLNLEFGWLPLYSDIRDVCEAAIHSHEALKRLRAGSGVKTRVGYSFPSNPSYPSGGPTFVYSVDSNITGWGAGSVVYSGRLTTDTWFKGCYTYYVPVSTTNMSQAEKFRQEAEYVLGLRPTLEAVWDAAPWSWAVDWAANVGDVARNISRIGHDGLTLQYGYIMRHVSLQQQWTALGGAKSTGPYTTRTSEWKVRYPASPYGFGLTYDGLSTMQKAILAAIGVTHFDVPHL